MRPVAYAGEPGAFAEDAVLAAFGDVERLPVGSFRDVFDVVVAGRAGAGMLPVENLLNGTVRETYDLLLEHDLVVVGEVVVPVRLCLAALPGQTLDDIERVYSHIQALGQAEAFLRTRPWTTLTTYNTAGAGKLIHAAGERRAAAVLSPRAAALFGMDVLAGDIQGAVDNRTRFVVVARQAAAMDVAADVAAGMQLEAAGGPRRTTVVFAVRNEPGTLLAALRTFAERGVNLSKLESRPSRTAAWEYVFWADLDADAADPACAAALDDLRGVSTMVRVFGSYARGAEQAGP
ncbi:MAG TPA: prephenate dehydratase domain-containing protein [Candidatus Limnocylindrales bacterium]